jgi:predicted Holliday junction resolvase-like endonuclease
MVDDFVAVFAVVVTAFLVYMVVTAVWRRRFTQFRKSSSQSQRATLRGQMAERVASLFPQFTWNPSDAHFLGQPIDYVIFDGLSEARDEGSPKPIEIVFVEAKSGNRTLTPVEKLVQEAVQAKRVRYELIPLKVSEEPGNQLGG